MTKPTQRSIRVRCPQCDHLIVTVPAGYRFREDLICPGCGAVLEHPGPLERLADGVEEVLGRLLHRGGEGKQD